MVDFKEQNGARQGDSFVSIYKCMVTGKVKKIGRCHFMREFVEILAAKTCLADLRQSELEISESGALTIRLALDSGRLVQDGYIRLSAAECDPSTKFTLHFGDSTAAIPFSGHQFSMPTKKSFGSHNRADFLECLAAQNLSFDGKAAPLVISEQDAFLAKPLFQYRVFSPQVLDNILLMAINPTRDGEEE
jgi:hypothetical protein